ncbi:MAG: redoxin domain-containing protein [Cyclobacteriaceae bacterium]|nr:redoxin domain-containing protein [Cyclobacteriaceae bacterium]
MRIVIIITGLILSISSWAQTGYKIDFTIKGLKDTTTYLGYYYGESTYVKDTARVNSTGNFQFSSSTNLPQGVYFLVLDKTRIFEFVIGKDQHFMMETSTVDYIKNMKVTGDEDNKIFFENMLFNMARNQEASPLFKIMNDSSSTEPAKNTARASLQAINEKVHTYQNGLLERYPGSMTARMLKATKPIEVPDPPKKADGSIDSTFQYRYYRQHFFDNFDISDDALIRLPKPFYTEKVTEYLEKLIVPQPDSVMNAIESLVAKVKSNPETYKYLVWTAMLNYQNPKIMGLDEVYVRLYDTYFASGEMDFWISDSIKKSLKDHADKLRLSLVGQTAKNLIMQDQNLVLKSMYDINKKYTVLFFFDPDCGHCREETPKLVNFYNNNKDRFNLEVYAVSADTSMQKMKNYIKEMKMPWITVNGPRSTVGSYQNLYDAFSTPTLYILDKKKKIIAKKPPIERLTDFLENYERMQKHKQETGGDE